MLFRVQFAAAPLPKPSGSKRKASCSSPIPRGVIRTAPSFSLRGGPNFFVLMVHRVVPAKLATRKSDGFVLSGKRSRA
jgi:hypothetical protein